MLKISNFIPAALAALWLCATPASAALLMTVDASDASNVQFISTSGLSSASSSGSGFGILLNGALTTPNNQGDFLQSSGQRLGPVQGGNNYSIVAARGTSLILTGGGQQTQVFTAGQTAFAGSSFANLNFFLFAPASFIGDIEVRDNFGQPTGIIVGQYQYIAPPAPVPLPAGIWLLISGLGVLGGFGRCKGALVPA